MRYRRGRALLNVVVAVFCVAVVLCVAVIYILQARENARRNWCVNHVKQLGLGVANVESATKRYPTATNFDDGNARTNLDLVDPLARPGSLRGEATGRRGYSWLAQCLAFVDESDLNKELRMASHDFADEPFAAGLIEMSTGQHFARYDLPVFHCPTTALAVSNAPDYTGNTARPFVSQYMAIVGAGRTIRSEGAIEQDGVIVSAESNHGRGRTVGEILSGTSKTIIICETREADYASWFDGQTAWVTGLPGSIEAQSSDDIRYFTAPAHAINWGPTKNNPNQFYFARADGWNGVNDRRWGPSSLHAGGVVMCGFADGHTRALRDLIDPTIWISLISREGGGYVGGCGDDL